MGHQSPGSLPWPSGGRSLVLPGLQALFQSQGRRAGGQEDPGPRLDHPAVGGAGKAPCDLPVVLTPAEHGYTVYVPDLDINTEGDTLADSIAMASDAIGLWGITTQDMGKEIPAASSQLPRCTGGEIATFALVDFDAYRKANDMRAVRKNVTLQSWLNDLAEKAGINFSQVLQEALKQRLGVTDR